MFICAFLTYGGVSLFVVIFAILPIAKPIFKELNIPWHLFIAAFMPGMATFTMTMLPGTPAIQNIIPTAYLGTTVTSGAWIGIVSAIFVIIINIWYIDFALKRSEKRGETYFNMKNLESKNGEVEDKYADKKLPNIVLSLIPPILLLVLLNLVKLEIIYTLMITVVVSALLFWKYISVKKKRSIWELRTQYCQSLILLQTLDMVL